MKTVIILLGVLSGYFLPSHSFSALTFWVCLCIALPAGFFLPDFVNENALGYKWDMERPSLKQKISVLKSNTVSLWLAVYISLVGIAGVIKGIVLSWKINQVSLLVLAFGIAVYLRLSNSALVSRKFIHGRS